MLSHIDAPDSYTEVCALRRAYVRITAPLRSKAAAVAAQRASLRVGVSGSSASKNARTMRISRRSARHTTWA